MNRREETEQGATILMAVEDDDVDVSEITKRIEKSLSSLDQAEVE